MGQECPSLKFADYSLFSVKLISSDHLLKFDANFKNMTLGHFCPSCIIMKYVIIIERLIAYSYIKDFL